MIDFEFKHFHFCCGLGGGKKGFNKSRPRVGNMRARWRCIGGIDVDPAAIRDFDKAGDGRPGTVMDLFTRAQYVAFHEKEPPADWREATPADIRRAAGGERIGNAVPPKAAEAIADVMGVTLMLAASGETFMLSSVPIWVQPVAIALSLAQGEANA